MKFEPCKLSTSTFLIDITRPNITFKVFQSLDTCHLSQNNRQYGTQIFSIPIYKKELKVFLLETYKHKYSATLKDYFMDLQAYFYLQLK